MTRIEGLKDTTLDDPLPDPQHRPGRPRQGVAQKCDLADVAAHMPSRPAAGRKKDRAPGFHCYYPRRRRQGHASFQYMGGLVAAVEPIEPPGGAVPDHRPGSTIVALEDYSVSRLRTSIEYPIRIDRRRVQWDFGPRKHEFPGAQDGNLI